MKATALTVCIVFCLCASLAECFIRPRDFARHFSTTLRKRADDECEDRLQDLLQNNAEECITSLFESDDLEKFNSIICSDTCGRKVYDLVVDCYEQDITGAVWDVLCANNSKGLLCYDAIEGLVQDSLEEYLDACNNVTADYCSERCVIDLEKSNAITGCCLYSYEAVENGLDQTDSMFTACGAEIPGLCNGGLTNGEVSIPGSQSDPQSSATTTTVSIFVLLTALLAALS